MADGRETGVEFGNMGSGNMPILRRCMTTIYRRLLDYGLGNFEICWERKEDDRLFLTYS